MTDIDVTLRDTGVSIDVTGGLQRRTDDEIAGVIEGQSTFENQTFAIGEDSNDELNIHHKAKSQDTIIDVDGRLSDLASSDDGGGGDTTSTIPTAYVPSPNDDGTHDVDFADDLYIVDGDTVIYDTYTPTTDSAGYPTDTSFEVNYAEIISRETPFSILLNTPVVKSSTVGMVMVEDHPDVTYTYLENSDGTEFQGVEIEFPTTAAAFTLAYGVIENTSGDDTLLFDLTNISCETWLGYM